MDGEQSNDGRAVDVDGAELEGGVDWEGERLAGERDERW